MKLSLNKNVIQIDNSSIVWNAYEFLNSPSAQDAIIQHFPLKQITQVKSSLPKKETNAIISLITKKRPVKQSKKRTQDQLLKSATITLLILNVCIIGFKQYSLSKDATRKTIQNQTTLFEKKKRRKFQQESRAMNKKTATILSHLMAAKIPILKINITPASTTLIIPKHTTTVWINHFKKNYPQYLKSADITQTSNTENTLTLYHESN